MELILPTHLKFVPTSAPRPIITFSRSKQLGYAADCFFLPHRVFLYEPSLITLTSRDLGGVAESTSCMTVLSAISHIERVSCVLTETPFHLANSVLYRNPRSRTRDAFPCSQCLGYAVAVCQHAFSASSVLPVTAPSTFVLGGRLALRAMSGLVSEPAQRAMST